MDGTDKNGTKGGNHLEALLVDPTVLLMCLREQRGVG